MKIRILSIRKRRGFIGAVLFIHLFFFGAIVSLKAQDQEIQQLLLNVQKLEQLKDLLVQMKDKYQIIQQGYQQVKSVTEGNFRLHEVFLDRLYRVSPEVKKYYRIAEIVQMQLDLVSYTRQSIQSHSGNDFADLLYLKDVFTRLNGMGLRNLEELMLLLSDNQLQMDDAERLSAVDRIHQDMKRILLDGQKITAEVQQLVRIRNQFKNEAASLQLILSNHGN